MSQRIWPNISKQIKGNALIDPEESKWVTDERLLTLYESSQGFGLQFWSKCGSTLCGLINGSVHGVTPG